LQKGLFLQRDRNRNIFNPEVFVVIAQINRIVVPLAQEIDRLAATGAFVSNAGLISGDGGEVLRETVVRALVSAALLAAPSTEYVCEALGAAALVNP
jgi:hypothetical protein